MKTKTKKWRWALLTLLTLSLAHPLTLSAQVNVTKKGITPPRNLWNYDHTQTWSKYGQMLGVKRYSSTVGDTLVGYLPVFYLGDSLLKVGTYTVVHTGNLSGYLSAAETDPTVASYTKTLTSASVLLTQIETVDGSGSLLDADLLDGQSGAYYLAFANFTGTASLTTQVSGVLPVANGGTNISSYTIGDLPYASGTTALSKLAIGTAGQLLRVNAGATAPEWFTPGYISANQTITLSGDVTGSGSTAITTTIANDAVTYAKMQNVSATNRLMGRITAGAGDMEELTGTQATTLLDAFTSGLKGLAPASGGGTTNFLRADGTWAAPAGGVGGSGTTGYLPAWASASSLGNSVAYNNTDGGVSINTTSAGARLRVAAGGSTVPAWYSTGTYTNTAGGTFRIESSDYTINPASTSSTVIENTSNIFRVSGSSNMSSLYVLTNVIDWNNSGTTSNMTYNNNNMVMSTGTIGNVSGVTSNAYIVSTASVGLFTGFTASISGNITNGIGLDISSSTYSSGTPGTVKAINIGTITAGTKWAIYSTDSGAKTYHNGNLLLGSATDNGTDKLQVTGSSIYTGQLKAADGTAGAPSYTFSNDLDVGMYRPTTNILATTVAGTEVVRWSAGQQSNVAGSASAPSYTFTGDLNNGWWSPTADVQAWSTAGIERMRLDNNGFGVGGAPMSGITVRGAGNTAFTAGNSAMTWVNTSSGLSMTMTLSNSTQLRIFDNSSNILSQWTDGGNYAGNVKDNTSAVYTLSILSGATFFSFASTNGAEVLTLGSNATGSTVTTASPFLTAQYTATAASALTAQNGMIIYVTSTNGTFTSIGYWARENGVWVKH